MPLNVRQALQAHMSASPVSLVHHSSKGADPITKHVSDLLDLLFYYACVAQFLSRVIRQLDVAAGMPSEFLIRFAPPTLYGELQFGYVKGVAELLPYKRFNPICVAGCHALNPGKYLSISVLVIGRVFGLYGLR